MTIPMDPTNINSVFDWIFHTMDVTVFGSVGAMFIFIMIIVTALLMLFNANKFTFGGFIASMLMAFGYFGYSIVGWIAPLGAIIGGLLIGLAMIKLFQ